MGRRCGSPVWGRSALRPTDLAERLETGRPNATKIVERLQDEGLALRLADPDDAHGVIVALSDAGREVAQRLLHTHEAWIARLSTEWAPEDVPALVRLLSQLITAYEGSRGDLPEMR
ncbi:MarR family winged helix-turn-helix transcriptional regulator [Microbacterium sp. NPDC056234]|uniref:MarR family winged helix-turn-helix transcriptional regulator n=1 Tax=Microbacterium sp. NPDC056234 TaxID=3345757 RepID=UPI0035DD3819